MQAKFTRSTGTVRRVIRLGAVAAAAVLMMSGCLPQYPDWTTFSASDAVGSWCGPAGDLLTVTDDQEFLLTHMSADFYEKILESHFESGDPNAPSLTSPDLARGRWEVYELSKTLRLHLSIDTFDEEPAGLGVELFASKRDGEGVLLYYASDPDLGFDYEFTKCDGPQPGRS
jgi:hypothetical protein